jgi:hypothetical protein
MSRSTPVVGSVPERHNPDGTFVGEPEVRVRCADCHAPAWIRVSEVEKARYRPELTAVDGDGEPAELLPPVLELIPGEAP